MVAEKKLKSCPFCGGKANIDRYGTPRVSTQYSCEDCGCNLETSEEWNHGDRWNTRALTPRQEAADAMAEALDAIMQDGRIRNHEPLGVAAREALRKAGRQA